MVERYQAYGFNWLLAYTPPPSAAIWSAQEIPEQEIPEMVDITYCVVYVEESCGMEASGKRFTHHICPHHNCIVVWLDS